MQTEFIDPEHADLDLRSVTEILDTLLDSQQQALLAVRKARRQLDHAIEQAASRLAGDSGRLILLGAGASGRLAVQDGAELWPTFGWPHERLLLCMAGGEQAFVSSIEGIEDDESVAREESSAARPGPNDVVIAVAASGRSAWTCTWLELAQSAGALGIGIANNAGSRLLESADCPVLLDSGPEVLAGSTRMAAGTAQKIALNLLSTTLMIRLHRAYGNLMVDMAAVNSKLDQRRIHLLKGVLPQLSDEAAHEALAEAGGWVKLAALIASGDPVEAAVQRLDAHKGSLRAALRELAEEG